MHGSLFDPVPVGLSIRIAIVDIHNYILSIESVVGERAILTANLSIDEPNLLAEAVALTMFLVEGGGVTVDQDKIVQWMNTMRLGDGGFISTVDTIVATEALVK